MNVRWSSRTASSSRARSIIQVMRNDEVAIAVDRRAAGGRARREPRRTLSNDALMPAPTTLIGAERVGDAHARRRTARSSAARSRASSCRFSRETTSVSRSPAHVQLLAGDAVLVEQREQRRSGRRASALEHEHVALAGDADDRPRLPRRVTADDRAVRRRIGAGQRRAASRARKIAIPFSFANSTACAFSTLAPDFGQLLRLLVRQRADAPRRRHDARIGGVDAVDVGADLAVLGAERRGHRDRGRVAAAAPERRDLAPVGHALVAGDDDDLAARELVLDAERPHLDDARVDVAIVGDDARLAAGEADRVAAELADRHRQQRHRDALAGGQQHVELAASGLGETCFASAEQLVGRLAHRGDDDDDVVPVAPRPHDALGDLPDAG